MSSSKNPFTPEFLKSKAIPDFLFQTNNVTRVPELPVSICFGGRHWIYCKPYRENISGKKISVKMLEFGDTGFLGLFSLGFPAVVDRC